VKILLLDNYDSFTYNLADLVERIMPGAVDVRRNDAISLAEVNVYDRIILSPGPGLPADAGILIPLIREYAAGKPILGVCLGHQAIGEAFGGRLLNLETVHHGVSHPCRVEIPGRLFGGLPAQIAVGRYHSWVIARESLPAELEVMARDANGEIMAVRHREYDVHGVQFHPESVLTPEGERIMRNWLGG
jgi:anthranilate synthase component 2